MQTFLSEPTLTDSVRVQDKVRLNKQFLEGWQILDAIAKTPEGGRQKVNGKYVFAANHPATNMWRGFEGALAGYLWLCKYELMNRGTDTEKITKRLEDTINENRAVWNTGPGCGFPAWYKDERRALVQTTHRYNLWHKDREWYAQYEPEGTMSNADILDLVCCPDQVRKFFAGKPTAHKPYYYPTHVEA